MRELIIELAHTWAARTGNEDAYETDEQCVYAMLVEGVKAYALIADEPVGASIDEIAESAISTVDWVNGRPREMDAKI